MLISDLMSSPVHACRPDDTISYARNLMLRHHISRVLVMDREHVVGIITKKDIGFRFRRHDPAWRHRSPDNEPVSSAMTPDVLRISPDSSIRDAMMLMTTHRISGFPVIDQGMVLGMVTKSDLLRSLLIRSLDLSVVEVMRDASVVTMTHSVDHVIDLMKAGSGAVVVAGESGHPAGIISESDLAFGQDRRDLTDTCHAGDIMRSPVITLPETARTGDVVGEMIAGKISSLVIVSEHGIKGIITRDDIIGEVVQ